MTEKRGSTGIGTPAEPELGTRKIDADPMGSRTGTASGCCSPAKQASCCEPSAKASCCGSAASGTCGCQSGSVVAN